MKEAKTTTVSLFETHSERLAQLSDRFSYRFQDSSLLLLALVHTSFANEQAWDPVTLNNERLEFLGDAVIDLIVGHALFRRYPRMNEGDLSKVRAALVNETHLAGMARHLELGSYVILGRGEEASGGRKKPSILASAYEAVMGAIFSDGGYEAVREIVEHSFAPWIAQASALVRVADAKSRLQEYYQERYNMAPSYVLEKAEGPDHAKLFTVSVLFQDMILGTAQAATKKEAEQKAAAQALAAIVAMTEEDEDDANRMEEVSRTQGMVQERTTDQPDGGSVADARDGAEAHDRGATSG